MKDPVADMLEMIIVSVPRYPKCHYACTTNAMLHVRKIESVSYTLARSVFLPLQNSHTYMNSIMTQAKKPTHTFQPTPVFCAIRNILFIVPLSFRPVFPNVSFIFSASAVESLISSPIFIVICQEISRLASNLQFKIHISKSPNSHRNRLPACPSEGEKQEEYSHPSTCPPASPSH